MQLAVMLLVLTPFTPPLPEPNYDEEYEDFLENRVARYGY